MVRPRRASDDPHGLRGRVRLRAHNRADILAAVPAWDGLSPLEKMNALRRVAARYEEEQK